MMAGISTGVSESTSPSSTEASTTTEEVTQTYALNATGWWFDYYGAHGDVYHYVNYLYPDFEATFDYDPLTCKRGQGDIQFRTSAEYYFTLYQWDGLPVHEIFEPTHVTDEPKIAASMFALALIGMCLAATSGYLVRKNPDVTRIVGIAMGTDALCRFINSITRIYYGKCTLDWECIKGDGYPFSGILLNTVFSTVDYASYLTMGLLQHWISVIRFTAVFATDHYEKVERGSLLYIIALCLLLWAFYLSTIGSISATEGGQLCFTGYHYTPSFYWRTIRFHKSALYQTLFNLIPQLLLILQALTLVMDTLAFVSIRKRMKESAAKNEVNMRFATMLVATNAMIFGKQLVSSGTKLLYPGPRPSYLAYPVYEFMHCSLISCIVITFNLSNYRKNGESSSSGNPKSGSHA